ncbi:MAG: CPBP family intramembrane glutamic endopeptidase [Thermocrispum sp.]
MAELMRAGSDQPAAPAHEATLGRRAYLFAEYGVLFFGLIASFDVLADGVSPIPFLVALGVGCLVYLLRQRGFDRTNLLRPAAVRRELRSILALWAAATVVALAGVAMLLPGELFGFPRSEPVTWAIVAVAYPLLSAYPQELIFRGFLFHRYRPAFGSGAGILLASAAAFGFAHIIFGNWFAVLATTIGGLLFAYRYQRSRSLLATSIEHGLYGLMIFTVGLGQFVYHGAG